MTQKPDIYHRTQKANQRVAGLVVVAVLCMVGASFAAVPLYDLICRVTAIEGATRRVDKASNRVTDHVIKIRFDANVSSDLNWHFKPVEQSVDVKVGENKLAFYEAKNLSSHRITGTALFKVMPEIAGSYFNKIQCFCFTEQTLEAGQRVDMPVSYFIDPEILNDPDAKDIKEITLSYTFSPGSDQTSQKKVSLNKTEKIGKADGFAN